MATIDAPSPGAATGRRPSSIDGDPPRSAPVRAALCGPPGFAATRAFDVTAGRDGEPVIRAVPLRQGWPTRRVGASRLAVLLATRPWLFYG